CPQRLTAVITPVFTFVTQTRKNYGSYNRTFIAYTTQRVQPHLEFDQPVLCPDTSAWLDTGHLNRFHPGAVDRLSPGACHRAEQMAATLRRRDCAQPTPDITGHAAL